MKIDKNIKVKEPLIAVAFSLLLPGLGHVYIGDIKRGLYWFAILVIGGHAFAQYLIHPATPLSFIIGYVLMLFLAFLVISSISLLIDVYRCAKRFNAKHRLKRSLSAWRRMKIIGLIVILLFFNPIEFIYNPFANQKAYKIPTGSMSPTFIPGDRIFVNLSQFKNKTPQRGDIVVFEFPDDPRFDFIQRIVGLPGETLEIKNNRIFINDIILKDSLSPDILYFSRGSFGIKGNPILIPEDNYFVLGDNSANSRDSRYWGFLHKNNIKGKAYKIYWPLSRAGPIK